MKEGADYRPIELAMKGEVDATVTNALNKEEINAAGHHYSGHAEIFAEYTGTKKYTMMLGLPIIRVSVDHGTGFGHAGQGTANELSLLNSIDYAARFARVKKQNAVRE